MTTVTAETPLARRTDSTPLAILQSAVDKGVAVETLERLVALQERYEENRSCEAFAEALAEFQARMPHIKKTRSADRFSFAGFDDIMRAAGPLLAEQGITVGFNTEHTETGLSVTCRLRVGAYHEDRTFAVPISSSLKVSEPQKYGASLSYAKRYCLCAALNIVVTDEDDEGLLAEPADAPDIEKVKALIERKGVDVPRFIEWLEADSVESMTVGQIRRALPMLQRKPDKKAS